MSQDDPGRTHDPTAPPPPPAPAPYGSAAPGQPYGEQQPYGQQPYGQQPPYPPPGYAPPYGAPVAAAPRLLPEGVEAGSMGARLVARIVDSIVVAIPILVVVFALIVPPLAAADTDPFTDELVLSDGQQTTLGIGIALAVLLSVLVPILYEVGLTAVRGATVGKQLMGLKVVDIDTGGLIGWGRSFVRWVIPFVASFFCVAQLVVYISGLWDSARINRGWHDLAARDVVIRTR